MSTTTLELTDEEIAKLMEDNSIDEDSLDAVKAFLDCYSVEDIPHFQESYSGKFDSDEEFAQDFADNIGAIDREAKWPQTCIDWEWAAKELMYDYSESNGYYFQQF
jgi:antirestriction protein